MGLIACHYRAAEWRHKEIELAAHDLLQYLDDEERVTAVPESLHEHPDGERDGLRRVLVDGAPLLTVARARRAASARRLAGASCSAPGASACTRRSTVRFRAPR